MKYEMKIRICTYDGQTIVDLFCKPSACPGDCIITEDNVEVIYDRSYTKKAIGFSEIVEFTLTFPLGVAAGVIASWIYDKLEGEKLGTIIIIIPDNKIYLSKINKEEITKIIEEVMGKDG